jgi:hypothetical protein
MGKPAGARMRLLTDTPGIQLSTSLYTETLDES